MTKMHPLTAAIRGAGGGGGSSSSRTPVESPDSLRSVALMRILDLVSEGEIYGFADQEKPLTCAFLNETPVENGDGSFNFENFQIESRTGTQTQDYIPGFDAVESESVVGVELTADVPWTRNYTNLNLDALRLRLSVPTLVRYNPNGDVVGTRVDYKVELSTDGGAFIEVVTTAFAGKTTTKFERSHLIQLPRATTQWTLRVTRITPASDSGSLQNQTYVEGFTEIIDVKLRLPMSAVVGIVISAEQFGNPPSRAYRLKGRLIKVPTNYDPDTRTYTGIWDGTFQIRYSNNPAWEFYDMALNPRYGLGHLLPEALVSKWSLYKIAQFCDELVPDGFGGMEPRFTANLYLQQQGDAMQVMQDMATMFRGIMYAAGGAINAVADAPDDPVYHYNQSNVIDGKFAYSGSGRKVRHTVALVSWNDMSDFGRAKVEYVDDPDGIARYGVQQTEIMAIGCTSRGQARRWGKYVLATARLDSELVGFGVGLDGTIPAPGKIVTVSDPLRAGKRMGGRLHSATINSVTVDMLPEVLVGHTLTVTLPNGTIEKRTIGSIVGNTLGVTSNFTAIPPAQSVWMVENPSLVPQTVRILGITERDEGEGYSIAAIKHTPGKYAFVEEGLAIEEAPISGGFSKIIFPPASIVMTHRDVADYNTTQKIVTLVWEPVIGATYYNVLYRVNQGSWVDVGTVTATTVDIQSMPPGIFEVQVSAINGAGYRSQPTYAGPFDIDPNIKPPGFIDDINTQIATALETAENAQATADGVIEFFWQSTPPVIGTGAGQAKEGDFWIDDDRHSWRVTGGVFADAQDDQIGQAVLAATNAQATADGKVKLFTGTVAPTSGMQLNDMFFNTTLKKTFRYNGADWNTPIADVTLDQLGGNGVNLLPDQYSTFEAATLPPIAQGGTATLSRDVAVKKYAGSLLIQPTSTNPQIYFCPNSGWNIPHTTGRKYILSFYYQTNTITTINTQLVGSASGTSLFAPATLIANGVMNRVSVILDASAMTDPMIAVLMIPTSVSGNFVYVDGIMVEEAIGNLNKPSTYVRGTAAGQAISALIAAQSAQATADGVIDIFPKGGSPPTGAKVGDYWQDATGKWWVSNGTIWIDSTDSRLPQVVLDTAAANAAANTAQTTANAKISLYTQPSTSPPTGPFTASNQWYQTDTKTTYYWNGAAWSLLADQTTAVADLYLANGDFELGMANWSYETNWTIEQSSTASLLAGGKGANRYEGSGIQNSRMSNNVRFKATAGTRVRIQAFINIAGAITGNLSANIVWFDKDGNYLGEEGPNYYDHGVALSGNWRRCVKTITAPANTVGGYVSLIVIGHTTGYWLCDSVRVSTSVDSLDVVPDGAAYSRVATGQVNAGVVSVVGSGRNAIVNPTFTQNSRLVPNGTAFASGPMIDGWSCSGTTGLNQCIWYSQNMYCRVLGGLSVAANGDFYGASISSDKFAVVANQPYKFNVRRSNGGSGHALPSGLNLNHRVHLAFYDAAGSVISYPNVEDVLLSLASGDYHYEGIVPSNAKMGAFFFYIYGHNNNAYVVTLAAGTYFDALLTGVEFVPAADMDLDVTNGLNYGKTANLDLFDDPNSNYMRRVGTSVKGSRKILGGARNLPANQVAGFGAVNNAVPLTANSSGQVTVNAFTTYLNGETVSYSAVTNAVVGLFVGSTYIIYCIDPYQDGGVRTWYAAADAMTAQSQAFGVVVAGAVKIPNTGSSGGGSSGYEPPGTYCVSVNSYVLCLNNEEWVVTRAGDIEVGDYIKLRNGKKGLVTQSQTEMQECVRFTARSGASLTCSRTAPIGLAGASGEVLAPDTLGCDVDVFYPAIELVDTIADVEALGEQLVQSITCHDDFFLAGDDGECFFAHHNYKYDPP